MRKKLLLIFASGITLAAAAQTDQPRIFEKFHCLQLSGNGEWMLGRSNTWYNVEDNAYYGETSLCNVNTGEIYGLDDYFTLTPYSRPISSKGVAILSTYSEDSRGYEVPYLIIPGKEPMALMQFFEEGPYKGKECYACAITDDASSFLAYYEAYPVQYPFICTLSDDYTVGTPDFLPLPEKDIFGGTPYSVQLSCISDDARTVAGMEWTQIEKVGLMCYPIIYTKNDDGQWTYSYPLNDLYDINDPEKCPNFYESQVALSPDGHRFACTQEIPSRVSNFPDYAVWTVNLLDGKYNKIVSENPDIVATRILDDGTVIGTFFATIKISYVYKPGATDFVDFVEYAQSVKPDYGKWMEDNLMVRVQDYDENGILVTKTMPDTGQVFVSDDFSVFASGFQTSGYDEYYNPERWSYAFTDFRQSGITRMNTDKVKAKADVYNIQGLKVSETDEEGNAENLSKGIYIINGKKIIIK